MSSIYSNISVNVRLDKKTNKINIEREREGGREGGREGEKEKERERGVLYQRTIISPNCHWTATLESIFCRQSGKPKIDGEGDSDSINLSLVVPYSHKLSSAASCSSDPELSGWWRHRCPEVLHISFLDCCLLLPLVTTLLLARRDNATSTASCLCIAPLFPSFVLVLLIYISFKLLIYSFSSFVYSFRLIIF